jgi:hypothetical protein
MISVDWWNVIRMPSYSISFGRFLKYLNNKISYYYVLSYTTDSNILKKLHIEAKSSNLNFKLEFILNAKLLTTHTIKLEVFLLSYDFGTPLLNIVKNQYNYFLQCVHNIWTTSNSPVEPYQRRFRQRGYTKLSELHFLK